ncbi:MAG: hypothetical protein KatS3mg111_0706 [Pirellulaceae bacterium]|nr:MAG: hypothetical protein KatS3mg111_0706 [Pirellulaceae bacterium]
MGLGIRPVVDFAFKRIFGSPTNKVPLMSLLNAILQLSEPIVEVEILNPFNRKEFEEAKEIVLDVRCRDLLGHRLNIEMQVYIYGGLLQRSVYYACSMYVDQLEQGDQYKILRPAISICLLNDTVFPTGEPSHHRFQLIDRPTGRRLDNAIEVHTVELSKYNLDEATIRNASKIEQWVFFLRFAQDYSAERLRELLPGIDFDQAIHTIEIIAAQTEDRQMYEQREKAIRDLKWALAGAREEGRAEGREEGRAEGREEGRAEGREEGERVGLKKGELAGKIRLLQELLGEVPTQLEDLRETPIERLESMQERLQRRLRERRS